MLIFPLDGETVKCYHKRKFFQGGRSMSFASVQDKRSTAAMCDGFSAAQTSFFALILAGIALAVSVVFFSLAVLDVRLQGVIVSIIILLVLVLPVFPRRRKR